MFRHLSILIVVILFVIGETAAEKFICESKRGFSPYPV